MLLHLLLLGAAADAVYCIWQIDAVLSVWCAGFRHSTPFTVNFKNCAIVHQNLKKKFWALRRTSPCRPREIGDIPSPPYLFGAYRSMGLDPALRRSPPPPLSNYFRRPWWIFTRILRLTRWHLHVTCWSRPFIGYHPLYAYNWHFECVQLKACHHQKPSLCTELSNEHFLCCRIS